MALEKPPKETNRQRIRRRLDRQIEQITRAMPALRKPLVDCPFTCRHSTDHWWAFVDLAVFGLVDVAAWPFAIGHRPPDLARTSGGCNDPPAS
jgi:hypothetical protein